MANSNVLGEKTLALLSYIKANGRNKSWAELTKMFNPETTSQEWARQTFKKHINKLDSINVSTPPPQEEKPQETIEEKIEKRVEYVKSSYENASIKQEAKALALKVFELQRDIELAFRVKNHDPEKFQILPTKHLKAQATAIVQWSDWHVDEMVKASVVNNKNEYNPEIAKQRANNLFVNTLKLTDTQRSSIPIEDCIIQLGGDFIGGYLHPELEQTNSMSPIEGLLFGKDLLCNGIDYILNHGKFKRLIFICNRGNHGRLTPKMQYANDFSMNLEAFLYRSLAERYSSVDNVMFQIDDSDLSYYEVYGKTLRFYHGHQIKSNGGIGGLTIPLYKAIHRWNDTIPAYYNFMCDKHVYSNPTPDCQINGSLKSFDAFAASRGFKYQEAIQSFTLLDSKRGITIKAPIFC